MTTRGTNEQRQRQDRGGANAACNPSASRLYTCTEFAAAAAASAATSSAMYARWGGTFHPAGGRDVAGGPQLDDAAAAGSAEEAALDDEAEAAAATARAANSALTEAAPALGAAAAATGRGKLCGCPLNCAIHCSSVGRVRAVRGGVGRGLSTPMGCPLLCAPHQLAPEGRTAVQARCDCCWRSKGGVAALHGGNWIRLYADERCRHYRARVVRGVVGDRA